MNKKPTTSGIIIILKNKKVLICHPTNSKWYLTFSFPKGIINENETSIEAAIRETKEEIGIEIDKDLLHDDIPIIFETRYKIHHLYKLYIDDISQIGLEQEIIPANQLQTEEVDWAGFVSFGEAKNRLHMKYNSIINKLIENESR